MRLSRGNILRGVRTYVAGSMRAVPRAPSGEFGPACVKRGEPQDRQRDATSSQAMSGGTRRGGAKPRGRNGIGEGGTSPTEARRNRRAGVDAHGDVDGGERAHTRSRDLLMRANPKREGRVAPTWASAQLWRGAKARRSASPPRGSGRGRESLEGGSGNRQPPRGRAGKANDLRTRDSRGHLVYQSIDAAPRTSKAPRTS